MKGEMMKQTIMTAATALMLVIWAATSAAV